MIGTKTLLSAACLVAGTLSLSACSTFDSIGNTLSGTPDVPVGTVGNVQGFLGGVAADEPQAAITGRNVLSAGGTAADAVTAMGFQLAVTLPSRAGLGSGGACLVYKPGRTSPGGGAPEAILFPSTAPANPGGADRPAGTPMLARGLFALQARYGQRPIETLIVPAEQAARFGVVVSRALLRDLAVVAGPLSGDPGARAVFFPNGSPLSDGATLSQPGLGGTLAQLRVAGVGDLYQGQLARRLEDAMPSIGGGLKVSDLRGALPHYAEPIKLPSVNNDVVAFLPASEAGGIATAVAAKIIAQGIASQQDTSAQALVQSINTAAAARNGASPDSLLAGEAPAGSLGPLPASTVFGAIDRDGGAAICAVSMGNLFGTGRIAGGTGILMGASPARQPQPLLSLALEYSPNLQAFRAMAGGSGQEAAPVAAAMGLAAGLTRSQPALPPEPGRATTIACPGYLPKATGTCSWSVDPRNLGLAIGSN
jgi:gamma-glutamyltranspeptidase/glutathione hydrolase